MKIKIFMQKTNKINININKDDQIINDFLFCWSEIGHRPCKSVVYKNYEKESFLNYFSSFLLETTTNRDIIPFEPQDLINERNFCKIDHQIWVTYTIYDKFSELSFIGDVAFYYPFERTDKIDEFISGLDSFQLSEDEMDSESEQNVFTITLGQTGLELDPIEEVNLDFDNIECHYNDEVMKQINKLSKKIKKSNKGLSIIHGERGTGKTSLIHYMNQKIKDKKIIFIPPTFFDSTINHPDFKSFLKKNKNSIIFLDDCEIYFSELYSKSNIFTNNLLQLVDGFDSDQLGVNLILILNCEKESDIDPHLIESNNLLDIVRTTKLEKSKIQELCKLLEKKCKFKSDTKLIDVLRNKPHISSDSDIGFI